MTTTLFLLFLTCFQQDTSFLGSVTNPEYGGYYVVVTIHCPYFKGKALIENKFFLSVLMRTGKIKYPFPNSHEQLQKAYKEYERFMLNHLKSKKPITFTVAEIIKGEFVFDNFEIYVRNFEMEKEVLEFAKKGKEAFINK